MVNQIKTKLLPVNRHDNAYIRAFSKTLKIGLVAALGIAGVVMTGELMAATPQVVATIQTGPEWEPLPRAEPLTVPEVHYRVKHAP